MKSLGLKDVHICCPLDLSLLDVLEQHMVLKKHGYPFFSWVYVRPHPPSLEIAFYNQDISMDSLSKLLFLLQFLLKTHDVL